MYTVTPAGAGGFKIRQEDGKGNIGAYEPGIFATEVEARAHIVELTTPKTKTQTAAKKKAAEKTEADAEKEVTDKSEADAAIEKEVESTEVVSETEKGEVAEKPAKKAGK